MIATNAAATAPATPSPDRLPPPSPDDARTLRRMRIVTRRRVRIDVASVGPVAQIVSDGALVIGLETVSERDPRVIAWRANREVDLVVLHDGCGARAVGVGGLTGRLEVPGALGDGAFLAFCYDAEPA